jgi:hypothetical protein
VPVFGQPLDNPQRITATCAAAMSCQIARRSISKSTLLSNGFQHPNLPIKRIRGISDIRATGGPMAS